MVLHLARTIAVAGQLVLAPLDLLAKTFDVLTESFDDYLDFGVVVAVLALRSQDVFVLWELLVDLGHFVAYWSCATVALNTFEGLLQVVRELRGAVPIEPNDFVAPDEEEFVQEFVVVVAASHPNDVLAEVVQLNVYIRSDLIVRVHN